MINPRIHRLDGVQNFRDMGGYVAANGQSIRYGSLFRSGHLSHTTTPCREALAAKGILHVIDFRSDAEKSRNPVAWQTPFTPSYHSLSIGGNAAAWVQELFEKLKNSDFPGEELRAQFLLAFRTIPIENRSGLKAFFTCLTDEKTNGAVLFHCTAGKDRTGIAGALVMAALGIDPDQIMEDFLLTNTAVDLDQKTAEIAERLSIKAERSINPKDLLPLVGVEADFLHNAFQAIQNHSGSMENYLHTEMGLTENRLQMLKGKFLSD
ncbi:tyrosine-protein phosphatase [Kordiimonas pumila]|uniref:Tyrosine-protein phosphatase n=1 Tax=Kordiimonas pumila TaxID=2161677 RepID=A0ABV7D679_9PROT|nr:tyrosine-protein phosphatase [Kordiimonas pumila]